MDFFSELRERERERESKMLTLSSCGSEADDGRGGGGGSSNSVFVSINPFNCADPLLVAADTLVATEALDTVGER